jgi:hypothetical protein
MTSTIHIQENLQSSTLTLVDDLLYGRELTTLSAIGKLMSTYREPINGTPIETSDINHLGKLITFLAESNFNFQEQSTLEAEEGFQSLAQMVREEEREICQKELKKQRKAEKNNQD